MTKTLRLPILLLIALLAIAACESDDADSGSTSNISIPSPTPTTEVIAPPTTTTEPAPAVDVQPTATTAPVQSQPTATDAPAVTVELYRGQFRNGDDGYTGSGTAIINRLPDGRYELQLQNFRVDEGPGLEVYLVPLANSSNPVSVDGFFNLGELQAFSGNQTYNIDFEVAPGQPYSVVIWCAPFSANFTTATLQTIN